MLLTCSTAWEDIPSKNQTGPGREEVPGNCGYISGKLHLARGHCCFPDRPVQLVPRSTARASQASRLLPSLFLAWPSDSLDPLDP